MVLLVIISKFELLNNYLSNYDIFVLFEYDLRRDVFQFNEQNLKCLMNIKACNGSNFLWFSILKA